MAKKLVILGGGTGGLIVANLLADYYETVVVDRRKETVFQPGQLFVAFKGESPNKYKKEIKEVLNPKAKFIQSEVTKIDLDNREVLLKNGSKI
nr:NAD(P)/FAD-dependent oxidoreductase [Desulfurococcales archaeon]